MTLVAGPFPVVTLTEVFQILLFAVTVLWLYVGDRRPPSTNKHKTGLPSYGFGAQHVLDALTTIGLLVAVPDVLLFFFWFGINVDIACFVQHSSVTVPLISTILATVVFMLLLGNVLRYWTRVGATVALNLQPHERVFVTPVYKGSLAIAAARFLMHAQPKAQSQSPSQQQSPSQSPAQSNSDGKSSQSASPPAGNHGQVIGADVWQSYPPAVREWALENCRREGVEITLRTQHPSQASHTRINYTLPCDTGEMDVVYIPFVGAAEFCNRLADTSDERHDKLLMMFRVCCLVAAAVLSPFGGGV